MFSSCKPDFYYLQYPGWQQIWREHAETGINTNWWASWQVWWHITRSSFWLPFLLHNCQIRVTVEKLLTSFIQNNNVEVDNSCFCRIQKDNLVKIKNVGMLNIRRWIFIFERKVSLLILFFAVTYKGILLCNLWYWLEPAVDELNLLVQKRINEKMFQ